MAKGIKEKKVGRCEYRYWWDGSYCGRKVDKRYPDVEGRNYCIFHSHNDEKRKDFFKLINEAIDKANTEVRKAIDAINSKETDGKTRSEKIEGIRMDNRLDFEGFYFSINADFSGRIFEPAVDFSGAIFSGVAGFLGATFNGDAKFFRAIFSGEADFDEATFNGAAHFGWATFSREVDFEEATFSGKAYFREATFSGEADFFIATFNGEADFRCKIKESTTLTFDNSKFVKRGIFTGINLSNASFNGAELHNSLIQDIQYSNTTKKGIIIDTFTANTNRIFARDAADYNYIHDMKKKCEQLKENSLIFLKDENLTKDGLINRFKWELLRTGMDLWKITSNYGRCFALWFAWSLGIALLFGFLYMLPFKDQLHYGRHTTVTIEKSVVDGRPVEKLNDKIKPYDDVSWFTPFYYSIVTFTTLGFGDVVPDTGVARAYVALEVFLGYIMLGGLISIFANKLARRA